jgi:TatD DNase family protein
MMFVDTHAHLYLKEFDADRPAVVERALQQGVKYILLPNIDGTTVEGMLALCDAFPRHCLPMMGLHPGSVKENNESELKRTEEWLGKRTFCAVGEIGMDLYWDSTYAAQQEEVLRHQITLAVKYDLPVVLHSRNAIGRIMTIIRSSGHKNLKGVFHCFSGTTEQAVEITAMGFLLGIGGMVTFRNSTLAAVVSEIGLQHIVLETDAPYLAPVPFRGKRNESAHIPLIAGIIASLKGITVEEVASATTENAVKLFHLR